MKMRPERKKTSTRPVTETDFAAVRAAAQRVVDIHGRLSEWLYHGVTLPKVNRFVGALLDEYDCRSCFRGYRVGRHPPFPSQACLSVNECIVHGTAGYYPKPIGEGDLLKIDVGVEHQGWIGDAVKTYVFGEPSEEAKALTECGKESIRRGIAEFEVGKPLVRWAKAVQSYVEEDCGFHLVRGLGGHGYGRKLHEPPYISNIVPEPGDDWPDAYTLCEPGMLLAVEPMIAVGTPQTRARGRGWPIYTADGSLSVHYEHDLLITEDGVEVLTQGLDDVDDRITR